MLDKIISLAKRRGFIFQSSEIYGGISGFWDYGPLGVELKNNIKKNWWKEIVYTQDNIVGIDAAIIMNPIVWERSGHVKSFVDLLVECKKCHHRFRQDKIEKNFCPNCQKVTNFTEPKKFNILTEVFLGVTEPKQKAYLRGEITQGVFVNFKNVVNSTRLKIPFGIAQIGKAFRNEITPGNFTFRSREFEQMEIEYFIYPNEKEGEKWFSFWKEERLKWYLKLGFKKENLRFREHLPKERAHYARRAIDIEYKAPFGWSEFEGIHHRGDWDMRSHNITYYDTERKEEYFPWVIESSAGVDRVILFLLLDSYYEDEKNKRVVLKFIPELAPIKIAIFPLLANKKNIVEKAKEIYRNLKKYFPTAWDDRGNIGKRYYAQDEIGTPFCVTVDFQSLDDDTVTIRFRDTTEQIRIKKTNLIDYFFDQFKNY